MKTIRNYEPPSTAHLAALKESLGLTGEQMADLAAIAGSNQWRKYTGGHEPRKVGPHMLFWLAARLELSDELFSKVLKRMRDIGASFDFTEEKS